MLKKILNTLWKGFEIMAEAECKIWGIQQT